MNDYCMHVHNKWIKSPATLCEECNVTLNQSRKRWSLCLMDTVLLALLLALSADITAGPVSSSVCLPLLYAMLNVDIKEEETHPNVNVIKPPNSW